MLVCQLFELVVASQTSNLKRVFFLFIARV